MAKQTYTVKVALIHERKIYQPGESVTINDDKLAIALLKRGQIADDRATPLPPQKPPPPEKPPQQQQQQPPPPPPAPPKAPPSTLNQ